ncbi:MAG TPA: CHAD domain-containing protein [Solirubrobacteraceae bacterium]|nr:CHAD domain-containing protein [Solirubrobacteraceae bacterium]
MRARKVKGLDAAGTLADNAERIVRVRLDELTSFMPKAADPDEVVALHDMRIAAKRLRYVLEVTGSCFGPYAETAVKHVKDLQDLLGEIHDCDVQLPEVAAFLEELVQEDVEAAGAEPRGLAKAPNRRTYAGLVALRVHLQARRRALFADFVEQWRDLERKGFAARLAFALSERSHSSV